MSLGVSLMDLVRLAAVEEQQQLANRSGCAESLTRRWRRDGRRRVSWRVTSRDDERVPIVFGCLWSTMVA